jgi:hypothetical protein
VTARALGALVYGAGLLFATLAVIKGVNGPSAVTPQVLLLTAFLTWAWGIYFAYTVEQWLDPTPEPTRVRRAELIVRFRRMIVALCALLLPASFYIRTFIVLLGLGDAFAGQIVFFALAGANIVGAIFVLVSLKFD